MSPTTSTQRLAFSEWYPSKADLLNYNIVLSEFKAGFFSLKLQTGRPWSFLHRVEKGYHPQLCNQGGSRDRNAQTAKKRFHDMEGVEDRF